MPSQKLMFPSVFLPFIHFVLLSCTSFVKQGQHARSTVDPGGNLGWDRDEEVRLGAHRKL